MAEEFTLKAVPSSLPGRGDAKMSEDVMDELGVYEGEIVLVRHGSKSLKLEAALDLIYAADTVRLRFEDMQALGTREGDEVVVSEIEVVSRSDAPKPEPAKKKPRKRSRKKGSRKKKAAKKAPAKKKAAPEKAPARKTPKKRAAKKRSRKKSGRNKKK